jgi:hypothetical protein
MQQIVTNFAPGTKYATMRPWSKQTFRVGTTPLGGSNFQAAISATNLAAAIGDINSKCGLNLSGNLNNWAVVGSEAGIDGGGISVAGTSQSNLALDTTTDALSGQSPGQTLQPGKALWSGNGKNAAIMQQDGNFVVYKNGAPAWSSVTYGRNNAYLSLQPDGNLVINWNGNPIWWTGSSGAKNNLVMQDDGNLVLYSGTTAVWATGTN